MSTFSNVRHTGTTYQIHQKFILFVHITISSSASCLYLFHPFLLFFTVLIDTSATPASVYVCNSEIIGDHPASVSKILCLLQKSVKGNVCRVRVVCIRLHQCVWWWERDSIHPWGV
jgi:hypothetical protein